MHSYLYWSQQRTTTSSWSRVTDHLGSAIVYIGIIWLYERWRISSGTSVVLFAVQSRVNPPFHTTKGRECWRWEPRVIDNSNLYRGTGTTDVLIRYLKNFVKPRRHVRNKLGRIGLALFRCKIKNVLKWDLMNARIGPVMSKLSSQE